jgi:ElaB/YqjD/DUF883 family membrane-anchored ribosome-binding protein
MADTTDTTPPPATPRRRTAKPKAKATAAPRKPAARKPATTAAKAESQIRNQIAATTGTIKSEAQRKASEIGEEVTKLYGQAGDRARDLATKGKNRAAEGLGNLAKVIDDSAVQVDDTLGKQYGDFARQAAQSVAGLAGTLDEKDVDELVEQTREFVRKSPAVALGSAAVVGFMLARLLRGRN